MHLGIFVTLNIRRKIHFELENTKSLAAKTQSFVHSNHVLLCFLFQCYFVLLQPFIKELPRIARFQALPSGKVLCSKPKCSKQNKYPEIRSSCPTSVAAYFSVEVLPTRASTFFFAGFPIYSTFLGHSVTLTAPPAPFSSLSLLSNLQAINFRPASFANYR